MYTDLPCKDARLSGGPARRTFTLAWSADAHDAYFENRRRRALTNGLLSPRPLPYSADGAP